MKRKEGQQSNETEGGFEEEISSPEQLKEEAIALNDTVERDTVEVIGSAAEIQTDPVSNYEEKEEARKLSQQADMTRRDFLKNAALLAGAAVIATPEIGRAKESDEDNKSDSDLESGELSLVERNRKLLVEGEFAVPEDVIKCLASVVSPNQLYKNPLGGYFRKDFIDTKDEEKEYRKKMKKLGYMQEEAEMYRNIFSGGNIAFNESSLDDDNFEIVLAHERMHKELDNLPEEMQQKLDEARDYILDDYRKKEMERDEFITANSDEEKIDYIEYGRLMDEFLKKSPPIMLNKDGNMGSGPAMIAILLNKEEFYTYLMMGDLHPGVEKYIKSDFSDAYEIYAGLKDGIYQQIEQSKKE